MKPLVWVHRVHTFNKIGKLDTFYQKIFLHHDAKEKYEQHKKNYKNGSNSASIFLPDEFGGESFSQ